MGVQNADLAYEVKTFEVYLWLWQPSKTGAGLLPSRQRIYLQEEKRAMEAWQERRCSDE